MILCSWGANSHGQLSAGLSCEQIEHATRLKTDFIVDDALIKQIACGGGHSLLLDSDGKLFSCGWNFKLQCGKKHETNHFERVWKLSGIVFTNIVCGWDFSCGVTDTQLLFVWGSNSNGQLGLPKDHFSNIIEPIRLQVNACAVSMGLRHTAIINSKGEVWVTGDGKHGQLGLGPDKLSLDMFTKVHKVGKVSHIACGQNHTLTWSSEEHALYVWGDNKHGQLLLPFIDNGKYRKVFVPQKIDIDVRQGVIKLLSGWTNALLWLENGALLTWGRNNYSQLGTDEPFLGKLINLKLPGGREVKDVALGSEHTICLATDNTLWAWGWNEHANTGINGPEPITTPTQVAVESIDKAIITHIYAGGAHNFIVMENEEKQNKTDIVE